MNNDQGHLALNSIRRADLPTSDSHLTNAMNKSTFTQRQQPKTLRKPFQVSQQLPMMSRCSDSSSLSCPLRCECGSTL
jgi:hypothetical protein